MKEPFDLKRLKRSGKDYKTNCLHCGGILKMYISFDKGIWHCFRCNKAGRIRSGMINAAPSYTEKEKDAEQLPEGDSIGMTKRAREYLQNRNIKPYKEWYFCKGGKYAERIIMPVVFQGRYRGFQARTIDPDGQPRYLSSIGLHISRVLWGMDYSRKRFPDAKTIFISEGIFGSCRIHELAYPSACSFTKRLSATQAAAIATHYTKVILAYDLDALSGALHAGFQLFQFGIRVAVLNMKHKGPDDHTLEELGNLEAIPLLDLEKRVANGTVTIPKAFNS